ncbi:MAG TPA: serine hydrolase [Bacteroidia bacterium]|nr:serine hydrolase [Bacteroidia bacterium]
MNIRGIIVVVLAAIYIPCCGQNLLSTICHNDSLYLKYQKVFTNPEKYHLQVIYTQVNRDKNKRIVLKKYLLEPPTKKYYYPASLVKLPLAALALEKINKLKIPNFSKDTRLSIDSSHTCETKELYDTSSITGFPSISQYIKRMLLISDNNAYSRVYEFLSSAYVNKRLHELGYVNATINQRLNGACDSTNNRYTNGFSFLDNNSKTIYTQPPAYNSGNIKNRATHTTIGKAFMDGGKKLPPKNFRRNNYIPFEDENNILLSLIYPNSLKLSSRFNLTQSDYAFLKKYMSMLPRESTHPTYDNKEYPDNYKKYIYFGTSRNTIDTSIRSYNIVGRAYGFLADCSYIKDSKTGVEFFLSILIYVNDKDILNTDDYQYDSIGLPFMSDMGHAIYNYELKRKKKKK